MTLRPRRSDVPAVDLDWLVELQNRSRAHAYGKIEGPFAVVHRVTATSKHVFAALARAALRSPARRRLVVSLAGALAIGILPSLSAAGPSRIDLATTPAATGGWLDRLNSWRTGTGLSTLTEVPAWSQGDYNHSVYMVKNDLVNHYETPGTPYYTPEGDTAARNSNIYVSSSTNTSDVQAIDFWMQAPFHAMGLMDPRLTQTGFGSYREVKSGWQLGAAVDTLRGNSFTGGQYPVYFPGNGSSEPLTSYGGGEFPDPLQACPGYTVPSGLPVFVQIGGNIATTAGPVHSFTGNGVALEHCVIDSTNPAVGSNLTGRGGVIVIPRQPLQSGVKYVVALTVNGAALTWSFSVGAFIPPFGVSGVTPNAGSAAGGTTVTITGSGFSNGMTGVQFGATAAASFHVVNDTAVTAVTPAHAAGTVDVTVTTAKGTSAIVPADHFTFGWESLGGSLTSGGGPSSCAAGNVNTYVLGGDGVPWFKHWNGTTWSPWTQVGGNVMSNPSSVCDPGASTTHIFTEGVDYRLYHRVWNGAAFGPWDNLGGSLGSGPGSASCDGQLHAFVLNTDGTVYWKTFAGSWAGWTLIGGHVMGNPAAACELGTPSNVDLFTEGVDHQLYHKKWNGSTWGPWENLGGSLTSSPAATSCAFGTVDVFVLGGDGVLWRKTFNGTSWSAWTLMGGNWTSDPGAVCQPGTTKIDLFERGSDNALWWRELPN